MPLYDYDCAACGRRIEVVHGVYAPGPTHCPHCGSGPLKKAIAAPAVHFKGSGWAKRDRRATVAPGSPKAAGETSADSDGSTAGAGATKASDSGDKSPDGNKSPDAGKASAGEPSTSTSKGSGTGATTGTGS